MPSVPTTGSSHIAILDSTIIASLCDGKFYVSAVGSVYIGSGADLVLGANVQITNPDGVIVKPYGASYEIAPALSAGMDAVISFNIPTIAGNYRYGKYRVDVQLFDGALNWTVTKYITVCEPDKNYKTRNYGSLSAKLIGSCKEGRMTVLVDNVPTYNGVVVESQVNSFTLTYPTSSGLAPQVTTLGAFSVILFEGVYKIVGEICATYNFGDNVYVKVKYKVKKEKDIRCLIDECCVFTKLSELHLKTKTDCTDEEKQATANITLEALALLKTAQLAAECGEDASDYISDLEKLLGCKCTCNCAEGTPIIDTSPAKDFAITGCNVTKSTVGLTDNYVIENYAYVTTVVANGGALVITAQTLDGCTKTQTLTLDIAVVYAQIKSLANASLEESAFWASIINKILAGADGGSINNWDTLTLKEKFEALLDDIVDCCSCSTTISAAGTQNFGADVRLKWIGTGHFSTNYYLDGLFVGNVLATAIEEVWFYNAADGDAHTWTLIPVCENGRFGGADTGTFTFLACPSISPPVVSSNNVNGVACPYDLTTLLSAPPAGITVEWHTANNTQSYSLVPDATEVSSGVYYAFAKNSDGCFSTSTVVTLICAAATSCTAPQTLLVTNSTGGFLVQFQSAAFPPPSNSYTVKRRLSADPDVDGSYTTIGTPVWNASSNRWEILDTTAVSNTLYTYKAISNCGGSPSTTPFTTYEFANITCPSVTYDPDVTTLGYSFTGVGGGVTKYEVKIYNSSGTTLIHTDTHLPAFPNPITGTFTYLTAGTTYKVRVKVFIGTYSYECAFSTITTDNTAGNSIIYSLNGVIGASLVITDGASPANTVLSLLSTTSPQNGTLGSLTGQYTICAEWASGSGNVIQMRICDSFGNQVFYDASITIGEGASCYTTPTLPFSAAPYYVYVTAGDVVPPSC